MKKTITAVTFILFVAMLSVASADGGKIYKTCQVCHGADGSKAPLGVSSAVIKGRTAEDIEAKLKGYADGSFGGAKKSVMVNQVKHLSEADIKAVAEYISKF